MCRTSTLVVGEHDFAVAFAAALVVDAYAWVLCPIAFLETVQDMTGQYVITSSVCGRFVRVWGALRHTDGSKPCVAEHTGSSK